MKVTRVGPDEIFHRYLTPKWAFLPTSGAGAAIDGGRFNRPGVEALYLSLAPQTALEEYKQGASITPPATLAAYKITLSEVADHRGSTQMPGIVPGRNGIVSGARSLASTGRYLHRGSLRTWSSRSGFAVSCFPRCATPAALIW